MITLARIGWNDAVERALAPVLFEDLPLIRREVEAGVSELWAVRDHGLMVTRVEDYGVRRELVVIAAVGRGGHEVMPALQAMMRPNRIDRLRVHSHRPAMGRYLRRHGFREVSRVYEYQVAQEH